MYIQYRYIFNVMVVVTINNGNGSTSDKVKHKIMNIRWKTLSFFLVCFPNYKKQSSLIFVFPIKQYLSKITNN